MLDDIHYCINLSHTKSVVICTWSFSWTKMQFLVDVREYVSEVTVDSKEKILWPNFVLYATNGSEIPTFGVENLK